MKKFVSLLLAVLMTAALFTGCAKQPAQSDPADTTEPAQTTDTTPEDSTIAEALLAAEGERAAAAGCTE